MYVLGSVVSPVTEMQIVLRNQGYLKESDVDGVFGKTTMTAAIKLGLDAVTDFAGSLNAGGGDPDARQIGSGAMRGVQTKLQSAIGRDGRFSGSDTALRAVKDAQTKLKNAWAAWIRAGGRPATDRAAAFTSMVISKSGSGSGSRASSAAPSALAPSALAPAPETAPPALGFDFSSPKVIIGLGVGAAALLVLVAAMSSKKTSPAMA